MCGELVVVLDPAAVAGVDYLRKLATQLGSKTRFLAAQFVALLGGDLWYRNAAAANAMAARLAAGAVDAARGRRGPAGPGERGLRAGSSRHAIATLARALRLRGVGRARREVRWMTSFATTDADVDRFLATLASAVSAA